ncbi:hypothetical protein NC658_32475 [Streptomyces griseoincarnatus]|uniref:Secreted protein n=1 Tax=Streptomyces griseoincarnatus TaxID=29305 RepID=A0ABT0W3V5_STRGI|nr:hypothetical protein [Streptomyces griseoincarnatus]MCM2517910.1 hypothetical protein [Streptomyces griseoincarnatus]
MRALRAALAAITLIGGTVLVAAAPANAAPCGTVHTAHIDGASAHWKISCGENRVKVDGWVQDTRRDAMCARVTIDTESGSDWPQACGKGKRVVFHESYFDPHRKGAVVKLMVVY